VIRLQALDASSSLAASQQGGGVVAGSANTDAFAALDPPLVERILHAAFVAGGQSVATRAQLSLVSKCAGLRGHTLAVPLYRPATRLTVRLLRVEFAVDVTERLELRLASPVAV